MRCLYCGKELALLKRWTGGGEFCSEAHRQQYQEEYNKLALNRLLQAQPGEAQSNSSKQEAKPNKPEPAPQPVAKQQSEPKAQPKAPEPKPAIAAKAPEPPAKPAPKYEEPVRVAPEPVGVAVQAPEEEEGPAESAGFFLELPVPLEAPTLAFSQPDVDFESTFTPVLPERNGNKGWGTDLVAAGRVLFQPSIHVLDYAAARAERRLEVRDFVRSAPIVEIDLRAAGETGLMETSEEPMDILIFPHPPQGSPPLWQEAECGFKFETELGALARFAFGTTGVEDNLDPTPVAAPPETAKASASAPPAPVEKPVEKVVERAVEAPKPTPVPPPAPKAEPVAPRPAFARPPAKPVTPSAAAVVENAPEKKPEPKPEPVPDLITKPLPLTLHGIAAGRGKPLQVFTAAVTADVDVQIPRSNALPLRPVMMLGPAIEEKKIEQKKPEEAKKLEERRSEERRPERTTVIVKSDPKRVPGRPDPRFVNGKGRKPEPEKPEEKVAAAIRERAPEPAADKKTEPKVEARPETKPIEQRRPEPKPVEVKPAEQKPVMQKPAAAAVKDPPAKEPAPEPKRPAPLSAPYTPPDLGLPNLALESSNSFWSRLPVAAKIGAAALVIAGVVGIVMLGGKNKGVSAGSAGEVFEAGTPLAVVDSGWITDWGAEPGVRRVHEISVLRPSLTLSDYRVEFQAQIETKALGWVYRAKDGKNYYVNRLEIVKPGLDPTVALVRFAVINGEEQPRSQFPLTIPVHVDTLYKIRFDAVGDRFTTYVQDQKVDEFTDARIKVGGVGLYNERGERMSLKGSVSVVPLGIRK